MSSRKTLAGFMCGRDLASRAVRSLDGILGENGAVDFYRRQFQLFGDMGVFDFQRLINGFAAHPLGDER